MTQLFDAPVAAASAFVAGAGALPDDAFKRIVDQTAHPFAVIDVDGFVRYAGGSIERVFGWTAGEVAGRNMADFLPPASLEVAIAAVEEIQHRDPDGAGVPMVVEVYRKDGTTSWVEVGAIPMLDVPGVEGIVLRVRSWESQFWFEEFVGGLLGEEPVDAVLEHLARSIAESLEVDGAVVHYRFDGTAFAGAAGFGVPVAELPLDVGPWCDAAFAATTAHVDVAALPAFVAAPAIAQGFRSCWTAPVPVNPGLAPAVLSVWRRTAGPPLLSHEHVLERSVRYVQLALVRTAEHQRLRHLAGHDSLTGVANRAEFRDRLAQAIAIGERDIAVAFCDLDDFKPVNDTYGHRVGDDVLVEVAKRLRSCLRTGDELARLGGDEFTVLLRNVPDEAAARHVADRLLAAMTEPFRVHDETVSIGLSVGIALSQDGMQADALLERADEALYEVKRAGKRGAHIVAPAAARNAQAGAQVRSADGLGADTADDGRGPRLPA